MNTIRLTNGLDTDQDGGSVGPDLGKKLFAKVISSYKSCCLISSIKLCNFMSAAVNGCT